MILLNFFELAFSHGMFNYEHWRLKICTEARNRQRILTTVKAIEGFMMCNCMAMGLLQMIALRYFHKVSERFFTYLRALSKGVASETMVMAYLRR